MPEQAEFRPPRSRFASRTTTTPAAEDFQPSTVQVVEREGVSGGPTAEAAWPEPVQKSPWNETFGERPAAGRHADYPPYDGKPLVLTPDGVQAVPAYWYRTRELRRTPEGVRWRWTAYWAVPNTGRRLDIDPIGWARQE